MKCGVPASTSSTRPRTRSRTSGSVVFAVLVMIGLPVESGYDCQKTPGPEYVGTGAALTHVSPTKKGGWQAPLSLRLKYTPAGVVFANLSELLIRKRGLRHEVS